MAGSNNALLNRFVNFNSQIYLNFDQFLIDDKNYLQNVNGNLYIEKNKIRSGKIAAKLNNLSQFIFQI